MADIFCYSAYRIVVDDKYSVVKDSYSRRNSVGAVFIEYRSIVDDVICVPFSRLSHRIYKWCLLFVDTSSLSVCIGFILVVVENLNLISALKEYAAVTSSLAFTIDHSRCAPFDMQLEASEFLFGLNTSGVTYNGKYSVMYIPFSFTSIAAFPFAEVFAVEEDDGIRWG